MITEAILLTIGIAAIPFIEGLRIGLKDELKPIGGFEPGRPIRTIPQIIIMDEPKTQDRIGAAIIKEGIEVLVSLGYQKQISKDLINKISQDRKFERTEDLVKAALKQCAA